MKILSLRLVGYKRLLLRQIRDFEITPESIHQIIIGTNGSGKSSVMKELSPLPAFAGNYIKGGSKTIKLRHRGKLYTLGSDFSLSTGKHSFIVEGEGEQNPGGTSSVQKELVKQHFVMDEALFDILNGKTKFSTMAPLKRRELLIAMSECDLDFAMDVWNKLKSRARDMQGVVKHLTGRITQETDKLPTGDRLEEMRSNVKTLKEELTLLMESKELRLPSEREVRDVIARTLAVVEKKSLSALTTIVHHGNIPEGEIVKSIADVDSLISSKQADLTAEKAVLDHNNNEYGLVKDIVEALQASNATGIEDLQQKIIGLREEQGLLRQKMRLFHEIDGDASIIQARTSSIYGELVEILSGMPGNAERLYARDSREKARVRYDELRLHREKIQKDVARFEHRLEHIAKAKQENCPKCGYIWTPGLRENEERETLALQERANAALVNCTGDIETVEKYLEDVQRYADYYRRFQRLLDNNVQLDPLWDYFLQETRILNSPASLLPIVETWQDDLILHVEIAGIEKQVLLFEEALIKAGQAGQDGHYSDHISRLTVNIEKSTDEVLRCGKLIDEIKQFRAEVSNVIQNAQQVNQHVRELHEHVQMLIRVLRRDIIDEKIGEHQSSLAHQESALTAAITLEGIIADLSRSREDALLDLETFKVLADELSPVDGLIADQLKGFIQCFVDQLNDIISQVWTYDMLVQPCGMDSGELDYKFPVVIGPHRSDDIADTSTGQVEMFDFAFKLVVMLYMGLEDYPLYMDELGPHLDEQHRINIMHFVRTLVETKKCSQMFLISHYASMHGIFPSAEICVMDERNIALPAHYNSHVKIG